MSSRRSVAIPVLVLLALVAAGCMAPADPPGEQDTFRLGGEFTADATQEDVRDLESEVEMRGGTARIMESDPMRFDATGLDRDACTELRAVLENKPYLQSVGGCALTG